MNVILTISSDDGFVPLLLQMLESLGDRLEKHALGIWDIGLSKDSKDKIRKLKPDAIFKTSADSADVADDWNVNTLAKLYQPFACNIFPNYDAYVHIDADLWFADPSALDDMIEAGMTHGIACVDSSKLIYTTRKRFLGITIYRLKEDIVYSTIRQRFGKAEAKRLAGKRKKRMNGGFYCIKGGDSFWQLYQDASRKSIDYLAKSKSDKLFSDQTAFLYALLDSDVPHKVLPFTHNCTDKKLVFDKATGDLHYPDNPEGAVKVVHLTGGNKDRIRTLKTTDGGSIETSLTYNAMQKLKPNG